MEREKREREKKERRIERNIYIWERTQVPPEQKLRNKLVTKFRREAEAYKLLEATSSLPLTGLSRKGCGGRGHRPLNLLESHVLSAVPKVIRSAAPSSSDTGQ